NGSGVGAIDRGAVSDCGRGVLRQAARAAATCRRWRVPQPARSQGRRPVGVARGHPCASIPGGARAMTTIPLGFEVGPGTPVAIPLKHLAITGQTQEAGKTTALEALITRSKLRALTFVTKRGEGAFTGGRP